MAERIFTLDDLTSVRSVCGCLTCKLSAVFADHLTDLRTGYPGTVTPLGHRGAAPGTTAVPHFLTVRVGDAHVDIVVWEEMRPDQLRAWLPAAEARARLPQLAARIPLLVRIRQALRAGTFTPSGPTGATLASGGRYPSFRFLVEHWPQIKKEFTP
ncbi:hypothetical protein GCM10027160_37490 [Streptomyces calidiresistens]|uniref:Uncharacterized protein n=2 Tax=Streptomyces TaxID=1883 RepID=A0A7W3Y095_9ACTN|nr:MULTISPECIES: hypothetical protein [Streptomyces]MBB0230246.1 hypothetical protein [Streptomyces calidiresistens]MBB0243025.1 hypothetical protein [Streptomyces alkaliphilus]